MNESDKDSDNLPGQEPACNNELDADANDAGEDGADKPVPGRYQSASVVHKNVLALRAWLVLTTILIPRESHGITPLPRRPSHVQTRHYGGML
jgi:hypothetical protein